MVTEIYGVKMNGEHDVVVKKFLKTGRYEPLLMEAWAGLAERARDRGASQGRTPTMLDIGAYSGLFALKAKLVGQSSVNVHAFELHPVTAAMLKVNISLNNVIVRVHETAVWKEDTILTAYTFADRVASSAATVIRKGGREFKVNARSVDSYGFKNVIAMKIDVERAEHEVLLGAVDTIEAFRPVIFTEVLSEDMYQKIYSLLSPHGYAAKTLDPSMYMWSPL